MARNRSGTTDEIALRLIAQGRIVVDPDTGVVLVDGVPRGITRGSPYQRISVDYVLMQAHRVVWLACKGPIAQGLVINHRDGNKRNNRLENLEAVTQQQNMLHAHRSPNYRGTYPGEDPIETFAEEVVEDTDWLMQTPHGLNPRRAYRIA